MKSENSEPIVIDTWAWIEYFAGTKEGEKAKKYIEGDYEVVAPSIVIAELSHVYRNRGKSQVWEEKRKPLIELISLIYPLEHKLADRAGLIKKHKRKEWENFGLSDGIIEATRWATEGIILTGDKHLLGENSINIS